MNGGSRRTKIECGTEGSRGEDVQTVVLALLTGTTMSMGPLATPSTATVTVDECEGPIVAWSENDETERVSDATSPESAPLDKATIPTVASRLSVQRTEPQYGRVSGAALSAVHVPVYTRRGSSSWITSIRAWS